MSNEDMEGKFFGGGALEYVVSGGEIYLQADQLALMFLRTGMANAERFGETGDKTNAILADALISVGNEIDDLRSELFKREIEASFMAEFPDLAEELDEE